MDGTYTWRWLLELLVSHRTLQHIHPTNFQALMAVFDRLPISGWRKQPLAFRWYVSTGTVLLQLVMKYEACKSMAIATGLCRLLTKYDWSPLAKPGLAKASFAQTRPYCPWLSRASYALIQQYHLQLLYKQWWSSFGKMSGDFHLTISQ